MILYLRPIAAAAWLVVIMAMPGFAADRDETETRHRFGDDVYAAGVDIRISAPGIEDVYAAGETVTVDAATRKTVHAIGRQVRINRTVGGDVYAAGYGVDVGNAVVGDVTAAGYRVELTGDGAIGGDALLAGRRVHLRGPVAGHASLAGETVEIDAPIAGSVEIRANEIRFGPRARIDGTLSYWSPRQAAIPDSVIPAGRVTAHVMPRDEHRVARRIGIIGAVIGGLFFTGSLILLSLVVAWLLPGPLTRLSQTVRSQPWLSLLAGAATLSALLGSLPVLGLSLIGIPLLPLMLVLIPLVLLAGYLAAAHMVGRGLLRAARLGEGEGSGAAVAAMLTGLVALIVFGLIPLFGWVVAVLAVIFGLGAWTLYLLDLRTMPDRSGP